MKIADTDGGVFEISGITKIVIDRSVVWDRYSAQYDKWYYKPRDQAKCPVERKSDDLMAYVNHLVRDNGYVARPHLDTLNVTMHGCTCGVHG